MCHIVWYTYMVDCIVLFSYRCSIDLKNLFNQLNKFIFILVVVIVIIVFVYIVFFIIMLFYYCYCKCVYFCYCFLPYRAYNYGSQITRYFMKKKKSRKKFTKFLLTHTDS